MRKNKVSGYNAYRAEMNAKLLAEPDKVIKRIFNLDANAYAEGALYVKTKEFPGLVASAVLRCDDCGQYHPEGAHTNGASRE
jgi:AhpD family alkylhydroperoxidase